MNEMKNNENKSEVERFVEDVVGNRNSSAYERLREIMREKIVNKVRNTLGEDA